MNSYSSIKDIKIGITGGSGFLGTRLIQLLAPYNAEIYSLVRHDSKIDAIRGFNSRLIYGDITDKASLIQFVKNIDICIHLAAMVGHNSMKEYKRVNVTGTKNLCKAILENNPNCRFVYCSSITALKIKRKLESGYTNYAKSKKLSDDLVEKMRKENGLKSTIIYPGLIYGPGDTKFIPIIIKNIKKIFLLTGGEENAPLIHIDDLCELFISVILNKNSIGKKYIGIGFDEIGMHEFFKRIAKKISYPEPFKRFPKLPFLIVAIILEKIYSLFSIKKSPPISKRTVDILSINFRRENYIYDDDLEWVPKINIDQGLNNYFELYPINNSEKIVQSGRNKTSIGLDATQKKLSN